MVDWQMSITAVTPCRSSTFVAVGYTERVVDGSFVEQRRCWKRAARKVLIGPEDEVEEWM
jgi:hypothetical protein